MELIRAQAEEVPLGTLQGSKPWGGGALRAGGCVYGEGCRGVQPESTAGDRLRLRTVLGGRSLVRGSSASLLIRRWLGITVPVKPDNQGASRANSAEMGRILYGRLFQSCRQRGRTAGHPHNLLPSPQQALLWGRRTKVTQDSRNYRPGDGARHMVTGNAGGTGLA